MKKKKITSADPGVQIHKQSLQQPRMQWPVEQQKHHSYLNFREVAKYLRKSQKKYANTNNMEDKKKGRKNIQHSWQSKGNTQTKKNTLFIWSNRGGLVLYEQISWKFSYFAGFCTMSHTFHRRKLTLSCIKQIFYMSLLGEKRDKAYLQKQTLGFLVVKENKAF